MSETQKKKVGLAIASLVCGCLFWFPLLGFICSPIALTLGIIALVKTNANQEAYGGKGMAISGIVLGGIGIIFSFFGILALIAIPQFIKVRNHAQESAAQSTIRTVISACEMYNASNNSYPSSGRELTETNPPILDSSIFSKNGVSGYSFTYTSSEKNKFNVSAKPIDDEFGHHRFFAANESGKIYIDGDKNGIAGTSGDTLLDQ